MARNLFIRKTAQLVVRPLVREDYAAWRLANSTMHPARNAWDYDNLPSEKLNRAFFAKFLRDRARRWKADKFYDFGIFLHGGTLVGFVALMDIGRGVFQNAYLGYRILNRHWGQGYGTEAVSAALDIGFRDLKLHRIEAGIEPANHRSIRLAKRLGMRLEGRKKRALYLRKRWVDILAYALTCEDLGIKFGGPTPDYENRHR
ncbi:MAG: GNAT family N-acetyltransferase [Bdellovibrionales bacterium]|nr:GNAT family N-acetyltransferase [Bdellovibrionales bacterium]